MPQRVIVVLMAVVLGMPALTQGQTAPHPNFSGAWKITNIETPERPAGDAPRGGGGGFGRRGGYGGRRGAGGGRNGDSDNANGDRGDRPQRVEVGQTIHIRQT